MNNPAIRTTLILIFLACSMAGYAQITKHREEPVTATETWRIDGMDVQIRGTVITGRELFTVHALVEQGPRAEENRALAESLARYGIEKGYLENAMRYNRYSADNRVSDKIVGVVLIHMEEEAADAYLATTYAFLTQELYGGASPRVGQIAPPRGFDAEARADLRGRLQRVVDSGRYDHFMEIISPDAGDLYDLEEAERNIVSAFLYLRDMTLAEDGILIYVGRIGDRRGFRYYIPAEIVPIADESVILQQYVAVLLAETSEGFVVYGIDLNFTSTDAADLYFGVEPQEGDEE
jgi:hypothetical protein